ncbi:Aspartokinase / Homoserine dehydrogenase [hydrothermal vent metagenome]|uniref:Aspartokinase / Homoserine dehydrogenase n=1 Tax=hydrothermal vent metagenome TaxID=652676 RepID=A0A3B0U6E3_9ZZZZ
MQVLKFGGTSVANAENISRVKDIIKFKSNEQPLIVVVSAFSRVTNKLEQIAKDATKADKSYLESIELLETQHKEAVTQLFGNENTSHLISQVDTLINKLKEVCQGVSLVDELTTRTYSQIVSFGERLSSLIIAEYVKLELTEATLLDPRVFIFTQNGTTSVDFDKTNKAIKSELEGYQGVHICPGFIASSKAGHLSTLGRGGSDYTAAIIAGALNASLLEIWTDVSGMMTADPRIVKRAHVIKNISYEEAMELSHFGAKVIYPPSIMPVLKKKIPIQIKNTFEPAHVGTLISSDSNGSSTIIKGLTSIKNIALVSLRGPGMVGIPNFSHRLFRALSNADVNVILITQASSEHSISVAILPEVVETAQEAIENEFELEISVGKVEPLKIKTELSIISIVGNKMQDQVGVTGKMFNTLGHNGVNVVAIANGSSQRNISVVIYTKDLKKALNSVHEAFFLSDTKSLNVFIVGVGNVGATLLTQIKSQQSYLYTKHQLDLKVVGLANSRTMCFDTDGIALDNWKGSLAKGEKMEIASFISKMSVFNLRNSVFVDNTASEAIASTYASVLSKSISIVTPNKVACSSSYSTYNHLKNLEQKFRTKFLFETNVGAGLPVISTLNDMVKSGDEILEVEGVLSGSLNFIFNTYDGSRSFANIVRQAKEEGYTEPDPRLDISGKDVMRKLLILAREAGNELEEKDIKATPCVPEHCMAFEGEAFFEALEKEEAFFKKQYETAQKNGKKVKYVAKFNADEASTQPMEVASDHPFYHLDGKDNIVSFKSRRYFTQPLVIKGAGAGAEVTASGIFADIIKAANT